ncbi:MAG TPA: MFS transporter [Candidatus Bathyarchaeia archaeon]|nr:MFS transporter [Candidatus Bathyarchaeia archaeon]
MRSRRRFISSGHRATLACAFVQSLLGSFVWSFTSNLDLQPGGTLVAGAQGWGSSLAWLPLLAGLALRVPVGVAADRFGPRRVGFLCVGLTLLGVYLSWLGFGWAPDRVVIATLAGVAGASLAASFALVSRWYPLEFQGLALGLIGAGSMGGALALLLRPLLESSLGMGRALGLLLVPILALFAAYAFVARDCPVVVSIAQFPRPLAAGRKPDAWYCRVLWTLTLGVLAGLAAFLPTLLLEQYHLSGAVSARVMALLFVAASLAMPVGGALADDFGGLRALQGALVAVAFFALCVASIPQSMIEVGLMFALFVALGTGSGALFQVVGTRFRARLGAVAGVITATGGLCAFVLPEVFELLRRPTGTYGTGFVLVSFAAAGAALLAARMQRDWLEEGGESGGRREPGRPPRGGGATGVALASSLHGA